MQIEEDNLPKFEVKTPAADSIYRKWIVFVVLSSLVLLALACAFGRFIWVTPVYDPAHFKLAPKTETIVVGASRSDVSFDTKLIPNCQSVGLNAEPIFFTYHKLRHILNNNPGVKNVILATGALHVSSCQNRYLFGGDSASRRIYMAYFPFLDADGKRRIRRFSEDYMTASARYDLGLPLGYMDDLKPVINHYRGRYVPSDFECWHGLGPVVQESHVSQAHIEEKISFYFYDQGTVGELSKLAMEHFEAIVDLCQSKGVLLCMVKTPLHPNFRALIPKPCFDAHLALAQKLAKEHDHVQFLDYSTVPFDTSEFLDGDHLNRDGAKRFTLQFAADFQKKH